MPPSRTNRNPESVVNAEREAQLHIEPERLRRSGMSHVSKDLPESLQVLMASVLKMAESPEHQQRLVERSGPSRREQLRGLANLRGIPEEVDLRTIALDDAAPVTGSMAAFQKALAWRGGRRRGLVRVVFSEPGRGKSAGMAHALLREPDSALWVDAPALSEVPQWGEGSDPWHRWRSVQVLALDDLGTEASSELVTMLLWRRYNLGRTTIATSNLSPIRFAERYFGGDLGPRLAQRLTQSQARAIGGQPVGPGGLNWSVIVKGPSLRDVETRERLLRTGKL